MTKDLVCGMDIDEKTAAKKEHNGKTYHFCSPTCQWAFEMDPEQFIQKET
ncbi:copper-translocating P-type ATPase protein [Marine Group I thaumarchaeote SCGC AAA799-P11]|uniref:Copper-translocating P-type ATPase protein n=1 Tax=Marine Group I thaumarchaeote SCGC AAA799-P11 TaxID=1502295 RepID=A0A087S1V9_9ARCH|nr:copper-translocating P-type ATPase protein [Marine Group I thaumarchaeote SCGC AAA799-P11]